MMMMMVKRSFGLSTDHFLFLIPGVYQYFVQKFPKFLPLFQSIRMLKPKTLSYIFSSMRVISLYSPLIWINRSPVTFYLWRLQEHFFQLKCRILKFRPETSICRSYTSVFDTVILQELSFIYYLSLCKICYFAKRNNPAN